MRCRNYDLVQMPDTPSHTYICLEGKLATGPCRAQTSGVAPVFRRGLHLGASPATLGAAAGGLRKTPGSPRQSLRGPASHGQLGDPRRPVVPLICPRGPWARFGGKPALPPAPCGETRSAWRARPAPPSLLPREPVSQGPGRDVAARPARGCSLHDALEADAGSIALRPFRHGAGTE